jgi:hypothetical protein
MRNYKRISQISIVIALIWALAGCSSLLPSGGTVKKSPWKLFDEAKASFDKIVINHTTNEELIELGFDPHSTPNIAILSYLDIRRLFDYELDRDEFYHEGVNLCVKAREACQGYDVSIEDISKKRVGNFWLDLLVVKREEQTTGWRFRALILLVEDKVVYKLWSGNPMLDESHAKKNPLGPLQDVGASLIKNSIQ